MERMRHLRMAIYVCVGHQLGEIPPLFQIRSPSVAQACLELRDAPVSDSRVVDY